MYLCVTYITLVITSTNFLYEDKLISVIVEGFEAILSHNVNTVPLNVLCVPVATSQDPSAPPKFECIYFGVDYKFETECLIPLEKLNKSQLLQSTLSSFIHSLFNSGRQLQHVEEIVEIMRMTLQECQKVVASVKNGSIRFDALKTHFPTASSEFSIRAELSLWTGDDKKWIQDRLKQIRGMLEFEWFSLAARVIQRLCEAYTLQLDDQNVLQFFSNPWQINKIPLSAFTDDLLSSGQILRYLQPEQIRAFNAFADASVFVKWLRAHTKSSQEFRTLMDLAQISAGAGLEMIRIVDCIDKAVTGYEALIFGLETAHTLRQLFDLCAPLWNNLKTNPNLPDALRDSVRHQNWLEQVKTTHGSVEQSALEQAKTIANMGTFVLTCRQSTNTGNEAAHSKPAHLLEVTDVLSLEIDDIGHMKTECEGRQVLIRSKYSFADLQELQSKLLLIAGQSFQRMSREAGVERFLRIFDQVILLARRYIKLRQLGTLIFDDLRCMLYCDEHREVSVRVLFGLSEETRNILLGRDNVFQSIKDLLTIFDQCISDW